MNKRHLHHLWRRFRVINPWYFVALAAVSGIICGFALRSNYAHMTKLREAVYIADEQGGDVKTALDNLRYYVYRHMNTGLSTGNGSVYPPIQLKYTYERLVRAASSTANSSNSQIYNAAQRYCESQNSADFSGRNRVPCIEQYVTSHGGTKPDTIPDALYKFDFVAPKWSPDLAGWSLVLTVIFVLAAAVLFAVRFLAKRYF